MQHPDGDLTGAAAGDTPAPPLSPSVVTSSSVNPDARWPVAPRNIHKNGSFTPQPPPLRDPRRPHNPPPPSHLDLLHRCGPGEGQGEDGRNRLEGGGDIWQPGPTLTTPRLQPLGDGWKLVTLGRSLLQLTASLQTTSRQTAPSLCDV
jgi:hypothetical protein